MPVSLYEIQTWMGMAPAARGTSHGENQHDHDDVEKDKEEEEPDEEDRSQALHRFAQYSALFWVDLVAGLLSNCEDDHVVLLIAYQQV